MKLIMVFIILALPHQLHPVIAEHMDVAQEDGDGAGEGGEPREEEALGRRVVVPLVRQPQPPLQVEDLLRHVLRK